MKKPELKASDFSAYLLCPTDPDRRFATDAYSHLAAFCFQAFSVSHKHLQSGGVRHGFNVVSRLIRCAADLYPEHAEMAGEPTEAEKLKEILLNSADTPIKFANMPNDTNAEIETFFGLREDVVPTNNHLLFRFKPGEPEGVAFIADERAFYEATQRADIESPPTAHTVSNKCPMMHVVRDVIWPQMVILAAEAPELITRDLEAAQSVKN